ncbi:glycosyltransferase family 4 protein [Saccharolobus islandicus]|nr:glycosyltransferase [Sulfolobus islandicus]
MSLREELFSFSKLAKELLSEYKKEIDSVDFAYVPHNYRMQLMSSILLSSLSQNGYGMLLMTDPHNAILEKKSLLSCIKVWHRLWFSYKPALEFCLMQKVQDFLFLRKSGNLKFIVVMNKGTLNYTSLSKYFNVRVLIPPHAFNPMALKYRTFDKDDYAVFLGRINTAKGAHEAIEVGKSVKLKMIGKPEQEFIVKKAKENGIEVIENVSEEEKFEILSRAKVLVLPSHKESFSVTILEALAVGTPVVTYDLPSLKSIYEFEVVKFVREFGIYSLAQEVRKMMKIKKEELEEMFENNELKEFLKLHSSWDNVANAIDKIIREAI